MKLFISYSHKDRNRAEDVAEAGRAAGHDVFIDDRLRSGGTFRDDLEREIGLADAVVVIWTASSVRSSWVREEAELARSRGTLRPVSIGVRPPFGFREVHTPKLGLTSSGADVLAALDLGDGREEHRSTPRSVPDTDWYRSPGALGRLTSWITRPR